MSELLIGKTLEQARYIIKQYELMLDEKPFDDEVLDEAHQYLEATFAYQVCPHWLAWR